MIYIKDIFIIYKTHIYAYTRHNSRMPITRQQARKREEIEKQECIREDKMQSPDKRKHGTSVQFNPVIDFVDASKEWRKNKKKGSNCTFEYIWI